MAYLSDYSTNVELTLLVMLRPASTSYGCFFPCDVTQIDTLCECIVSDPTEKSCEHSLKTVMLGSFQSLKEKKSLGHSHTVQYQVLAPLKCVEDTGFLRSC